MSGPHEMTVSSGIESIAVRDVLLGDVWVCGGQSNMELPMGRLSTRYGELMRTARCDRIRQFLVPRRTRFSGELRDYDEGGWEPVAPDTIARFYGVSYFFAARLHAQYGVPIGLINCAAGGSTAEAWMSDAALAAFPDAHRQAMRWRDDALVAATRRDDEARVADWLEQLDARDEGLRDGWRNGIGIGEVGRPIDPASDWALDAELSQNGAFWFEAGFVLPARAAGQSALLALGCIRDADFAYLNGELVGGTAYQYPPRRYPIRPGLLLEGKNTLVIRALSQRGIGGFVPDKPYRIEIGDEHIALDSWRFRTGARMEQPMPQVVSWEREPGGRHNGMLSPAIGYAMRGAIFYQGEANTATPGDYRALFRALVADWRSQWGFAFPFLYAQLANYTPPHAPPGTSGWPELREQQRECLDVPNTAMAVTIDVGEWNDLHPLNKREVGDRLALAARALSYGETGLEFSRPLVLRAYRRDGQSFAEAEAQIDGQELAVEGTGDAALVRYAWRDNPEGGLLCNASDLPASPFEATVEDLLA